MLFSPSARRLRRFSNVMKHVSTIGIVLIITLMLLAFIIPDWTRNLALARLGNAGGAGELTPATRAGVVLVAAIPAGVFIWGLWQVRALFGLFAAGDVFSAAAARRLQYFAFSVLAQAVLGPLSSVGISLALTAFGPSHQRMIALSISSHDYFALIVGSVLLAVTFVMREAAEIARENAGFV